MGQVLSEGGVGGGGGGGQELAAAAAHTPAGISSISKRHRVCRNKGALDQSSGSSICCMGFGSFVLLLLETLYLSDMLGQAGLSKSTFRHTNHGWT